MPSPYITPLGRAYSKKLTARRGRVPAKLYADMQDDITASRLMGATDGVNAMRDASRGRAITAALTTPT